MTRCLPLLLATCIAHATDFTHATIVTGANLSGPERKAVAMLVDAVRERTRITWSVSAADPTQGGPVVRIRRAGGGAAEGYRLRSSGNSVEITGNDERGVLFGIGGLLRALEMRRDSVTLPAALNVTTAPNAIRRYRVPL